MSDVFKSLVDVAVELGFEPRRTLIAAPNDFRLAPSLMEERDAFFSGLKATIETAVARSKRGAVVIAHSLGNSVFRYFLEWLKHDLGTFHYQPWLNKHITIFAACGPPALGAAETIRATLSGLTMGLPVSDAVAREMVTTFSAAPWMLPVTPRPASALHAAVNAHTGGLWPVHIANISFPSASCPRADALRSSTHEWREFSDNDASDGTLYRELSHRHWLSFTQSRQ